MDSGQKYVGMNSYSMESGGESIPGDQSLFSSRFSFSSMRRLYFR